jgi:precorrin-3B synthase
VSGPLVRSRPDRCPGALRPWPAADGALVRIRLVGGRLSPDSLAALGRVAREHGDGAVHLTGRANLQLRGLPLAQESPPALHESLVQAIEATGLLPSRSHELVRNLMVSPLTGLSGGRADLRPVARDLDSLIRADAVLAGLPGRFLFVLDDGRGDLADRGTDLGLVALDETLGQLRVGSAGWGPVVPLPEVAARLTTLARCFLHVRGTGPTAAWHVDELPDPLVAPVPPDARTRVSSPPLPYGSVPGGHHVAAPDGVLGPELLADLVERAEGRELVVTPWRGVLVPDTEVQR